MIFLGNNISETPHRVCRGALGASQVRGGLERRFSNGRNNWVTSRLVREMAPSGFNRAAKRLRSLSFGVWAWYRRKSAGIAPMLAPLLAGLIGLLFVYYVQEWDSGRALPSQWGDFVPTSWAHVFWMLAMAGGLGFLAFRAARKWPTATNSAAVLGTLTTVYLTGVTRTCDPPSGIVAGIVVAAITMAAPAVAKFVAGEAILAAERIVDEAQKAPRDFSGLVDALQIAMSMFMGFLVLVAFTHDLEVPAVRPLLLVFAGVGMTATASIKPELSPRNLIPIVGLVISVVGSYMQVDQVVDVDYIMAAVGVIVFVPFMLVAFRTHRLVPVLTVPVAATFVVMSLITLLAAMPAIIIGSGCGVGGEPLLTTAVLLGIVAIALGIATGVILLVMLLVKNRRS